MTSVRYDVLIVDDEQALSESTKEYFNIMGVKTEWVESSENCLAFFEENTADLILLDINLGESSGFELCKQLRQSIQVPILFISARTSDDDVLLALNIGGDDYIRKPYSLAVLLAKVNATLKRYKSISVEKLTNIVDAPAFYLDFETEQAVVSGKIVMLKAMEYKLLAYMVQNPNRTLSKIELFEQVWGHGLEGVGDNTLNVHVRHLREKIETDANDPMYIKTVWGKGYRFEMSDKT